MKAATRSVPMLKKMAMARVCLSGDGLSRAARVLRSVSLLAVLFGKGEWVVSRTGFEPVTR